MARQVATRPDRPRGSASALGRTSRESYIAQRLGIGLVTLFGMSVVIFLLLRLAPGNIVDILFSTGGYVNPSERAAIERELGLDKPLWAQYVGLDRASWRSGNLGKSYRYDLPAWEIIRPLVPVTLELAAALARHLGGPGRADRA